MHGVFHFKTCNLSKKIGVRSCTCSQELLSLIMTSVSGFCRPIIIRRDNWKCSHLDSSDWLNFLRSTIVSTNHTTVIMFVKVHSCNAKDFGRTFQFSLILAVKMTRWLQGPEMVASRKDSENRAGNGSIAMDARNCSCRGLNFYSCFLLAHYFLSCPTN